MSELVSSVSLRLRAGDDLVLEFAVTRNGSVVDISGMTARFVARRSVGGTAVLTTEGGSPNVTVTLTTPLSGIYRATVDKLVTATLSGTYRFESELQDQNTDVAVVARGYLTFEPKLI